LVPRGAARGAGTCPAADQRRRGGRGRPKGRVNPAPTVLATGLRAMARNSVAKTFEPRPHEVEACRATGACSGHGPEVARPSSSTLAFMSTVITGFARTPIGKYGGALASLRAVELGGVAIAAALERSGVDPGAIDEVLFGQVLQAGEGQITARQAATRGGLAMNVPAVTINKVCLSGMAAIAMADRGIRAGDVRFAVAGGMESMSNAPHVLRELRWGVRIGDATLVDVMQHDGLFCAFDHCTMGESSDRKNAQLGIDRRQQDEWSAMSHQRAQAATEAGYYT